MKLKMALIVMPFPKSSKIREWINAYGKQNKDNHRECYVHSTDNFPTKENLIAALYI